MGLGSERFSPDQSDEQGSISSGSLYSSDPSTPPTLNGPASDPVLALLQSRKLHFCRKEPSIASGSLSSGGSPSSPTFNGPAYDPVLSLLQSRKLHFGQNEPPDLGPDKTRRPGNDPNPSHPDTQAFPAEQYQEST